MDKRKDAPYDGKEDKMLMKRVKVVSDDVVSSKDKQNTLIEMIPRTSGLKAPIMQLTGHQGEVFSCKFDLSGRYIASGSFDQLILLWNTYGDCSNFGQLKGHKRAILDLQWSRDSRVIYSASADQTVGTWDLETGQRLRKHTGHEDIINCIATIRRGTEFFATGSDDTTISLWDGRQKNAVDYFDAAYAVTAVAFNEDGSQLFSGGLDNDIKVWDLRKRSIIYKIVGHADTITSLQISPDNNYLLSNAMDNTVRIFDIRPFVPSSRQVKVLKGALHGIEKNLIRASWSYDGLRVAAGSADRTVIIWDVSSAKLTYKLPGHKASVNAVDLHPHEPIILSASSDRSLFLGELAQ
ncbi:hypothetical protein T552_03285 [Pneumocystis carinii B80]|uniref:Uncharacterized protein n=1 Tax=Pneumocystis carinii (strain B80) TaxID=1408658 RepID=A0A0W4ZC78_PNEC8|nr:hypothetical protein T552_03285 [Pneumocystis carinii B80]KTW26015.1 hypothetical protein T552_03285 [Pneumocystis carinii B80]